MPLLRVLRDKRGYETTYLMDWIREGDRQRSRILYVFRTPPDVHVGSSPLEPVVMRELETLYPNIEFDWEALVSSRETIKSGFPKIQDFNLLNPAKRTKLIWRPTSDLDSYVR